MSKSSKRQKRRKHRKSRRAELRAAKRLAKIVTSPIAELPVELAVKMKTGEIAAQRLDALAAALNDCERDGVLVRLAHGAVITEWGYVMWIPQHPTVFTPGKSWQVRTRQLLLPEPANDEIS